MAKFYQVTKTIKGKDYTAQFNGIAAALEAMDNGYIKGSSNTSAVKMTKYLLENVIVEPKGLTLDDFDTLDELNEVTDFAMDVMQGNFRRDADEISTKETSK